MSYPTIPPYDNLETSTGEESLVHAAVSSLFLRALTAALLVGVIARVVATVVGVSELA
jgi:hypothetical protein